PRPAGSRLAPTPMWDIARYDSSPATPPAKRRALHRKSQETALPFCFLSKNHLPLTSSLRKFRSSARSSSCRLRTSHLRAPHRERVLRMQSPVFSPLRQWPALLLAGLAIAA